jgi:hypothetical protein
MTFAAALFAPLVLLLPGAADVAHAEPAKIEPLEAQPPRQGFAIPPMLRMGARERADWQELAEAFRQQTQNQVRIEQRMTIRIVPRPSPRVSLLSALPEGEVANHYVEKKMGKCVPVSGIAGVQVNGPSNLVLFMHDKRMITAALERACRARDFYSGFYLERNSDGKLCVDRDTLLSRSGSHCKLTRIRQLVAADD